MNQIHNDDCFKVIDTLETNSVDMVLVDLPYGQTDCDWDIRIDLDIMWEKLSRVCKDHCNYIFFVTTKFGNHIINSKPKWFRYDLVWQKYSAVGFLSAKKMPLRSHEMIYIFRKSPTPKGTPWIYNPQKTEGKPYHRKGNTTTHLELYGKPELERLPNITGDRHPWSVFKIHHDKAKFHPTQKPLELCEWLIKTYSNEGDVVLDFCMGSGSSIVAARQTKRNYIGVEKDPVIFQTAKERINQSLM